MPEITWAHVAIVFLIVVLILGLVALTGAKDLEIRVSSQSFAVKTKPGAK